MDALRGVALPTVSGRRLIPALIELLLKWRALVGVTNLCPPTSKGPDNVLSYRRVNGQAGQILTVSRRFTVCWANDYPTRLSKVYI